MIVGILEAVLQLKDELTPALAGVMGSLDNLGAGVTKAGVALLPLSYALKELGETSLTAAIETNENLGNVAALLTDVGMNQIPDILESMKANVRDLAVTYGKSTKDIGSGLYEVISIFGYTNDTFAQLEISAKAGAAGLATTSSAFNALSAVTLTYGDTSERAFKQAADLSFQAVNLGKITFPELAGAIGDVAPSASRLGVKITELYAALATASGVTGTVSMGATQLTSALNALENPTEQMKQLYSELHVETGKQAIAQYGLVEVLKKVIEFSESAGIPLMKLTRRKEANTIATSLGVQQYERFNKILNEMGVAAESNGSVLQGAFDRQTQTINEVGFAWEQFKIRVEIVAQRLGDAMLPTLGALLQILTPAVDVISSLVEWFARWPLPLQAIAIALGAFLTVLGPLVVSLGMMMMAFAALEPFFPVILAFFSTGGAVILGFGAVLAGLIIYWDDLADAMDVLRFTPLGEFFASVFNAVIATAADVLQMLSDVVKTFTFGLVDLSATAKNAGTLFDALKLSWLALKYAVVELGIAVLTAKKAFMFDGDPMKAELQKDIDAMRKLQLAYSDTAITIVTQSKPMTDATKEVAKASVICADSFKGLGEKSKLVGDQHKLTTAETKNLKLELESMKLKADFAGQSMYDLAIAAQEITFKTGYKDLAKDLNDVDAAARNAKLPLEVMAREAMNAAKLAADEQKRWNLAIDALKEKYKGNAEALAIIEGLYKKTDTAKEKTFNWGKALEAVKDAFSMLGVSADSVVMKAITALTATKAITDQLQKSAKPAEIALAGLNTAMIAYNSGATGGAIAGAKFGYEIGKLVPVIGPVAGAIGGVLVGGLLGFIGASDKARAAAVKLAQEINKMREDFIATSGGFDALNAKALAVGMTLDSVFKAKTVDEYKQAVKELNDAFELQKEAGDRLKSAMEKYGITIEQLGPKFRQQELDKMFAELYQDYQILIGAGVDNNEVIAKMAPNLNEYLQKAIATGSTIPEAMRPILQQMLDLGLLTDASGEKMTSLEGLTFAKTLEQNIKSIVDAVERLVNALLGIPNVTRSVTIITRNTTENVPSGNPGGGSGGGDDGQGGQPSGGTPENRSASRFALSQFNRPQPAAASAQRSDQLQEQSVGPFYFVIEPVKGTAREMTPNEFRKMREAIGSGLVNIPSRVISRRAR